VIGNGPLHSALWLDRESNTGLVAVCDCLLSSSSTRPNLVCVLLLCTCPIYVRLKYTGAIMRADFNVSRAACLSPVHSQICLYVLGFNKRSRRGSCTFKKWRGNVDGQSYISYCKLERCTPSTSFMTMTRVWRIHFIDCM
jgi:hypothetical protein